MGRALPLVVAVLVLVLAWMVPGASPAHLSALQAFELLKLPVDGAEDGPQVWERVLASTAATRTEEALEVALEEVRHHAPAAADPDERDHVVAFESIQRGLRQYAVDGNLDLPLRLVQRTGGARFDVNLEGHVQRLSFHPPGAEVVPVTVERDWLPPGRQSIVPPVLAVVVAILLRRPLVALFGAVWAGAFLLRRADGGSVVASLGEGFLRIFDQYLLKELKDPERQFIIGFVFFMLAMVGVMTRAGGIRGLMDVVARRASDARRTQVATWVMGLVIFFDDYANTILVGSTMRPLTDRFRVAREKLAYIVDSTAAPVAGLSIFSTWIAYEVSTFNQHLPAAQLDVGDGYAVFIRSIPYSFYCLYTMFFVGLVTLSGRDFGPMLTAERRARITGALLRDGAAPMVSKEATSMDVAPGITPGPWAAILPLLTFIGATLFEILRAGGLFSGAHEAPFSIEGITTVLYDGSGSRPLFLGSVAGFGVAAGMAFGAGLRLDILWSALKTVRAMLVGFAILYLAWMIGAVCKDLGTAPFLTALVDEGLDGRLLPSLLFVLAGAVAFATGSSWSTMSILLPLVVGLSFNLGLDVGLAADSVESGQLLMVMSIASVLSGAIFGDHCSPISDTTVMSSIASASDHIDHVRTQVPYAMTAMLVSILCGYLPTTYLGISPWLCLVLGCALLVAVHLGLGRRVQESAPPEGTAP